jgi:hypothetical protein
VEIRGKVNIEIKLHSRKAVIKTSKFQKIVFLGILAIVDQAYNPRYSGGRDQEDDGSRPAWTKKLNVIDMLTE